MTELPNRYVLSIMAKDRPGIVAAISRAVLKLNGNIIALSQTVLNDYFTIILIADFPEEVTAEQLREYVENSGLPGEFSVITRPYQPSSSLHGFSPSDTTQYVLTATGTDKKGIIHQISQSLATKGINILDIATYLEMDTFILVAQILVPSGINIRCLQDELAAIGTSKNISINLQHIDIFKATNRI